MTTTNSKHLTPVYQGHDKEADTRPATTTAAISQQTWRQKPSKKLTPYEPEWLWDYDYFIFAR